jgi:hypothetical protein
VTGFETITKNGKVSWRIRVSDPEIAEDQLVSLAVAGGGVTICEFGRKAVNLEEVFMDIVEEDNHDHV